jgi:hypothetical protein
MRLDNENVSWSEFEAAHEKNFAALLPTLVSGKTW